MPDVVEDSANPGPTLPLARASSRTTGRSPRTCSSPRALWEPSRGGSLNFNDADSGGFLSTGDSFTVSGNPTATYVLRVTVLFLQLVRDVYL